MSKAVEISECDKYYNYRKSKLSKREASGKVEKRKGINVKARRRRRRRRRASSVRVIK